MSAARYPPLTIIPDNDAPIDENGNPHFRGQKHAAAVAASLLRHGCQVRIVELPQGKDASEWLSLGGDGVLLKQLANACLPLSTDSLGEWRSQWETGEASGVGESLEPSDAKRESQAQILVALAEGAQLFHTPDGEAYARIEVSAHREVWIVRSKGFKQWLVRRFYQLHKKPPGGQAV